MSLRLQVTLDIAVTVCRRVCLRRDWQSHRSCRCFRKECGLCRYSSWLRGKAVPRSVQIANAAQNAIYTLSCGKTFATRAVWYVRYGMVPTHIPLHLARRPWPAAGMQRCSCNRLRLLSTKAPDVFLLFRVLVWYYKEGTSCVSCLSIMLLCGILE